MKIIHTGDVHLGSVLCNLPPEKARLRKTEIADTFRKLTVYARESGVDAVLIAGDLFDGDQPSAQIVKEALSAIASAAPVRFFCIFGNHDKRLELGETVPENLILFPERELPTTYTLCDGVTVTGVDSSALDTVDFESLRLPKETFNVMMLHGEVARYEKMGKDVINVRRLENKNIDYLALGHIHAPTTTAERIDSRGIYRYCGCLEGRGFDECGARGFFLLEIEKGRIRSEKFLSLAKRTLMEIRVDISACETYFDVENTANQALQSVPSENLVKLVLCGRYKPYLRKDVSLLKARLSERFFFVKVEDETQLFIPPSEYENDISERGEFIKEVGRYEMSDSLRQEILEVGLKALAGEEIDL